jgi:hypothetical protein
VSLKFLCCVLFIFGCFCEYVVWVCYMSMVHCAQKPFLKKYFVDVKVGSIASLTKVISRDDEKILRLWAYKLKLLYHFLVINILCTYAF